jgi:tetratricopeptide (TPR) repeat protein
MTVTDERVERSRLLYERALHNADPDALHEAGRELDAAEADLALARGRILHGRFLEQRGSDPAQAREDPQELPYFERAAELYRQLGDVRGEAEALFWIGCCQQVVRGDNATAVPVLQRSLELARQAGDRATMAQALRHLGIAEHVAGRPDAARARLEESVTLQHQIGQPVGVAANQVGLAYITATQGRRDDALAILDEATATCTAHGARGVQRHVDDARAAITTVEGPGPP